MTDRPALDGPRSTALVRDVPDFPQPGIVFKDITPLLADPDGLRGSRRRARRRRVPATARSTGSSGIEARGFILAAPVAYRSAPASCRCARRASCRATSWRGYALEYGEATLEVHADAFDAGRPGADRRRRARHRWDGRGDHRAGPRAGAEVVGLSVLIELAFLDGRDRLSRRCPLHALLTV